MSDSERPFVPQGWRTITPRIVTSDTRQLFDFIVNVFAASGEYRQDRPSVIAIGDSMLMISEAGVRGPMTAFLYVYVNDTDATYQRALAAGARSLEPPATTPYAIIVA